MCALECFQQSSCLYYAWSDVDALCFLCIYNDDDVFQNSLRLDAVDENRENDVIQLRSDVSSLMSTVRCSLPPPLLALSEGIKLTTCAWLWPPPPVAAGL